MKLEKYKCSWCWIEVEYNDVGPNPMEHNVDIWEILLKNCWIFVKIGSFNEWLVDWFNNWLI